MHHVCRACELAKYCWRLLTEMLNFSKSVSAGCVLDFAEGNHLLEGNCKINISGKDNLVRVALQNTMKNLNIVVKGTNNKIIILDQNNISRANIKINGKDSQILIGQKNRIRDAVFENGEGDASITVGDECLFSLGSQIKTHDSHDILDIETGLRLNSPRDIIIGNHVWISQEVMVLKGADIGDGSIIGARAMVTKRIPPNVVAAGMPAKVVREGVRWQL